MALNIEVHRPIGGSSTLLYTPNRLKYKVERLTPPLSASLNSALRNRMLTCFVPYLENEWPHNYPRHSKKDSEDSDRAGPMPDSTPSQIDPNLRRRDRAQPRNLYPWECFRVEADEGFFEGVMWLRRLLW